MATVIKTIESGPEKGSTYYMIDGKYAGLAASPNVSQDTINFLREKKGYPTPEPVASTPSVPFDDASGIADTPPSVAPPVSNPVQTATQTPAVMSTPSPVANPAPVLPTTPPPEISDGGADDTRANTTINGESYSGINTDNINSYVGTGSDTVTINGKTYTNFDTSSFVKNEAAINVVNPDVAPPPPVAPAQSGEGEAEVIADIGMGSTNPNVSQGGGGTTATPVSTQQVTAPQVVTEDLNYASLAGTTTKQMPNPNNDTALTHHNAVLANPNGTDPNTGEPYTETDRFFAKEHYKVTTGVNYDTGQPDAPVGPTTSINGESYTNIDTTNLDSFVGTGGTDTVNIDGQTYENFDLNKFRDANSTTVNPTTTPTTTTTPATPTGTDTPPASTPSAITPTPVTGISETDIQKGMIASDTGQITAPTDISATKVTNAATAIAPTEADAETYNADKVQTTAQTELNKVNAANIDTTDGLPKGATVTGQTLATGTPATTATPTGTPAAKDVGELVEQKAGADSGLQQIGLDAAQIDSTKVQTVNAPDDLAATQTTADVQGDLLNTNVSSVDQTVVEDAISKTAAATATPSEQATVQGQLASLTANFDASNPPAWAAGALRAANAQMAARGLNASSMAGQAILQATLESALPIAQVDASTFAQFEVQNLSNRQQVAMFGAQQRASFLELEFNQDFQMRVSNAARIADIADMNFSADQQIALENSRMAQSVDLANLNNRQAKVMADAAALTNLDLTELNNRQQAAVQNAQNFLAIEMANLDNEQQTSMFKAQAIQQALLSDQAAENAAKQFNATSQNQVDMHFATLSAQISSENADRLQAHNQFNAGAENVFKENNANRKQRVLESNAKNGLIIAQANAAWRNLATTTFNADSNEANRIDAKAATAMTRAQMDEYWQSTRDTIAYAYSSAESEKDRIQEIFLTELEAANKNEYQDNVARAGILSRLFDGVVDAVVYSATAGAVKLDNN